MNMSELYELERAVLIDLASQMVWADGTTSGEETREERELGETASDSEEKSEIPSVVSEDPTEIPSERWQE